MPIATVAAFDPWLEPYEPQLENQRRTILHACERLLAGKTVEDYALGHLYFGLHRRGDDWVLREWAPHATALYLVTLATKWRDSNAYAFQALANGVWELTIPAKALRHGDAYKLHVHWPGGSGYRIPAYAQYVVQDSQTHQFHAEVWQPAAPYVWQYTAPAATEPPLVYEAHVGMSGDRQAVSTYRQFADEVLPRIVRLGYNTVQLMAVQEHPYYGSFGYHVANFFAASSRFGTPDDLKYLIDTAHGHGLRVIMDIVHSHAVKNEAEGLSRFDGTLTQYFHAGKRGHHAVWDSRTFDYGKPEVAHFLLSNVRFWLDEYRFDGFRFDGVTSMLYHDHGLERAFGNYSDYVSDNVDTDALAYLCLANQLVHAVKSDAITIAEDMSGFPGLAAPYTAGGVGFDYRLSMGVPDLWIKMLKEQRDEDWDLGHLWHELTAHRPEEHTISYVESHDQALVGDKTLLFRLLDAHMYDGMAVTSQSAEVDRGIALHKMIRLLTATTHAGGYLTFMGNEFGHPEWIDFPREGNDWSYLYARRQWHLADDPSLRYGQLQAFDQALVALLKHVPFDEPSHIHIDQTAHVLSFVRGDYLLAYNVSPDTSHVDYPLPAPTGHYGLALSSDDGRYGGFDRVAPETVVETHGDQLLLYLPARTALVLQKKTTR